VKIVFALALFCCLVGMARSEDRNAPFTLAVVPSRSTAEERSVAIAAKQPETFYVVLTNTSDRAQPVWQTWCSWGFWTISFDITMPDGKRLHISRNHKEAFTKNSPATFLIPAGQHQVYPIQLDSQWENPPQFTGAGSVHITLKAIYEVPATPEATQQNVWVGRVQSPSYDLTLRHW
jgi:hypothetical protein